MASLGVEANGAATSGKVEKGIGIKDRAQIELQTPRLILRGLVLEDVDSVHEIMSNEDVMKYW